MIAGKFGCQYMGNVEAGLLANAQLVPSRRHSLGRSLAHGLRLRMNERLHCPRSESWLEVSSIVPRRLVKRKRKMKQTRLILGRLSGTTSTPAQIRTQQPYDTHNGQDTAPSFHGLKLALPAELPFEISQP